MRILPILFVACGVLSGSLANATTPPGKHLQPNAPRTVTVSDTEQPPVILTGQLQATLIVLPPEEKVATVFGGDTVNWVFDGGTRRQSVHFRQAKDGRQHDRPAHCVRPR